MKGYLIDENLPAVLEFGPSTVHVATLGQRLTDAEIWNYAKSHGLVIVTKDTDFYERIMLEGSLPKVIWIRLGI